MMLPQRFFILTLLVGQLFLSSAFAEKGPAYGVSNLLGEPSLAAKVSQGAEAVARKLSAGSASSQMNDEVTKLLDPRKPAPAAAAPAPQIPSGQQIVNLNAAPVKVSFPRVPADRPGGAGSVITQTGNLEPSAPQAVVPPTSDGRNELNAALEKVRVMLGSPVSKNSPTTPPPTVAAELEQIEAKVDVSGITRDRLGAQLPGAALNVPADWEREEVEALVGRKPTKSDLSGYMNSNPKERPAAPARLLDSLGGGGADNKPAQWKTRPKRNNSSVNQVLNYRNPLAAGSNRAERSRAKDFLAQPERDLRVAKVAPVRMAFSAPRRTSSGGGIREINVYGDAEAE